MTGYFCAKYFVVNKEIQLIVVSFNQKTDFQNKK